MPRKTKRAPKKPPRTKEEQRHYTMSRIRSSNTAIEVAFRKALWHEGIRYRKNYARLPGKPDIAITKHRIAIFCDGEFWHGKDWDARKPKIHSNREYWIAKIERNMSRDAETDRRLYGMGWTVLRFWGEDIKKNLPGCVEAAKEAISQAQLENYCLRIEIDD
ncbi:MAG: very short patch repair endonuclease [Clostridiales bacterium]|nr:very short patch repair endonuclease [Clostridiales bacterium]